MKNYRVTVKVMCKETGFILHYDNVTVKEESLLSAFTRVNNLILYTFSGDFSYSIVGIHEK